MYKNVDTAFKSSLTAISIGPGILGIERGVERIARLTHLAYVEIEAFIIENLVAQMERGVLAPAVIWSDCKTLPCEPFRGLVDILFAGYPCQPFSTAGKRRGTEDPRHLFPYIERAIRIIRPRACFFENVRGHVTCGLPEVIAALEGLGYRVHWGIYSAEETGAAHKRERVFILAKLANSSGFGFRPFRAESEGLKRGSIFDDAGNELAYSHNRPNGAKSGETESKSSAIEREEQRKERDEKIGEWMWSESGNGSEGMADNIRNGIIEVLERRPSKQSFENGSKWPVSRPGQPQQAWEHPRVISREVESSVGLSAHGYHFREDVLRALGNSVYADTAELAFKDLIKKHGILI